jgi:hypothetical protein
LFESSATRVGVWVERGSTKQIDLTLDLIGARSPEGVDVDVDDADALATGAERPGEGVALAGLLEARAPRADVGTAASERTGDVGRHDGSVGATAEAKERRLGSDHAAADAGP